jgi:hypothetical protein
MLPPVIDRISDAREARKTPVTDSIAHDTAGLTDVTRATAEHQHRWPRATRRGVQVTLGAPWLVDAELQLQPFMFTADFTRQVLAPAEQGRHHQFRR